MLPMREPDVILPGEEHKSVIHIWVKECIFYNADRDEIYKDTISIFVYNLETLVEMDPIEYVEYTSKQIDCPKRAAAANTYLMEMVLLDL